MQPPRYLTLADLLILTLIFWGMAIYTSLHQYLQLSIGSVSVEENLSFSEDQNYMAFTFQTVTLLLGMSYLKWRKFEFSRWNLQFEWQAIILGTCLFLLLCLAMDSYFMLFEYSYQIIFPSPVIAMLENITLSSLLYALLNGFYEELFFLGICLAVNPRYLPYAVAYSFLVRISFHTYQGLVSAIGIGLIVGGLMYLFYRKSHSKNLLPFWIALSLGDIFGLGVLGYFN